MRGISFGMVVGLAFVIFDAVFAYLAYSNISAYLNSVN